MATGTLTETVAEELEQAAVVTRNFDKKVISAGLVGLGIGVTIGFYIGYRYSKKKLRANIINEMEQEISEVRDYYQQKLIAVEARDKESVEDIVREKGYTPEEDAELEYSHLEEPTEAPDIRSIRPPVPVDPARPVGPVASTRRDEINNVAQNGEPYIISRDEFHANESGYARVSYLYYSVDDILVDEADPKNILPNRDDLIGSEIPTQFTHGLRNDDLMYIRNPNVELDIVIEHIPKSWEEEVLGFDSSESG